MSVSGISGSGIADYSGQNTIQQLIQEFQQLGKDLQSGNLSAAQSDFVTLQQDLPQSSASTASSSTQSSDPIAQAFQQLAQDLQSGNIKAALQEYTTIQQDFQSQGEQDYASQGTQGTQVHHGHHHHQDGGGSSSSTSTSGQVSQLFNELGQELGSGNLTAAQQTYASLQTDLQSSGQESPAQADGSTSGSASSSFSVNA